MKNFLLLPAVFTLYLTNPLFTCAQSHETPPQQNANGQRIDTDTLKEDISDDLIELEVEGIYEADMSALVRLVEKDSDNKWCLIMVIGECEATAMVRAMNEFESNRPLTYDLMNTIFTESSLTLQHIIITKLEDGVYYAVLVIDDHGTILRLDARPSDSINLALKAGVPIYAPRSFWDEAKEKMD
ncbi:MAG: bifunctional nuclease family protein [Bacteroidetes bacterium]|nr:bifunctional nuclease family protein [Bacteroidota bacterium]